MNASPSAVNAVWHRSHAVRISRATTAKLAERLRLPVWRRAASGRAGADELDAHRPVERPDRLATAEELANGRAALIPVVLRQLVDVHADEAVGELEIEIPPVLQRVAHRLV